MFASEATESGAEDKFITTSTITPTPACTMMPILKIAAMETTTAIWEYDPLLPDNWMLNGSLDVIAAIQILLPRYVILSISNLSFFIPLQKMQALGQQI